MHANSSYPHMHLHATYLGSIICKGKKEMFIDKRFVGSEGKIMSEESCSGTFESDATQTEKLP